MPCSHSCNCYVEGNRGLEGEGVGTAASPFIVEPSAGRWIGRTVATFADLPTEAAEEDGQFAFIVDEQVFYEYDSATTTWRAVGPEWRQTFPANLTLDAAAGVYNETPEFITLTPGNWKVAANCVLNGTMDKPTVGGSPGQSLDFITVEVQLFDAVPVGGFVFDATEQIVSNFAFNTADAEEYGFDLPFAEDLSLQAIITVPVIGPDRHMGIRAKRSIEAGGTWQLLSLDIAAVRVSWHDYTI